MRHALVLMAVAVLVAGCGSDDPDPGLSESIIGVWLSETGKYITFSSDGSHEVGTEAGTANTEFGTWSVEGEILTKVTDPESVFCEGIIGIYESEVLDDGERLESTVVEDECSVRVDDFATLTRHADS